MPAVLLLVIFVFFFMGDMSIDRIIKAFVRFVEDVVALVKELVEMAQGKR